MWFLFEAGLVSRMVLRVGVWARVCAWAAPDVLHVAQDGLVRARPKRADAQAVAEWCVVTDAESCAGGFGGVLVALDW